MLELVGLTDVEAKRRMRNYSLGMKQRLGLAHALLGDPEVLILDEPANGLDPAGIRWMRGLLKSYADRGGTVLLSSHLLNEVELIADEMILIGHGRIVAQGNKKSLLAGAQGAATSLVMSLDNTGLATELAQRGHLVDPIGDGLKVNASTEEVGRAALAAGIVLTDLRTGGVGLEDLFLELTSATARDGASAVPPPPPASHGAHVPRHRLDAARRLAPHSSRRTPMKTPRRSSLPQAAADPHSILREQRRGDPKSMSTATTAPTLDISATRPIPFWRLVLVELRKSYDTRAGFWLLATIGIIVAVIETILMITVIVNDEFISFEDLAGFPVVVAQLLLPVLGIILVTSEWGQRTAMVSFVIEPRRMRVVLAKLVVGFVMSVATVVGRCSRSASSARRSARSSSPTRPSGASSGGCRWRSS